MSAVSDQVAAVRRGAGLARHAERGVIEVSGTDRVRWLDGMLSADVAALAPGQSRSGCYALQLTRQGRILADHHVLLRDASLWLETRRDHIDDLITALDRYIIADDVALRDVSPELERLGLSHQVAFRAQELHVAVHFIGFFRVGEDDRDFSGLGEPFTLPLNDCFINSGLDNLTPYIIGSIHVEPFLIEAKTNGKGRVLCEDEMSRVKGNLEG